VGCWEVINEGKARHLENETQRQKTVTMKDDGEKDSILSTATRQKKRAIGKGFNPESENEKGSPGERTRSIMGGRDERGRRAAVFSEKNHSSCPDRPFGKEKKAGTEGGEWFRVRKQGTFEGKKRKTWERRSQQLTGQTIALGGCGGKNVRDSLAQRREGTGMFP